MKSKRIDFPSTHPQAFQAMMTFQGFVDKCGLESSLLELVKIRASQINGCAYCLDMHIHAARKQGETNQRLDTLQAWREVGFFSIREQIALSWTEALTELSHPHPVSDEDYASALQEFTPEELVALSASVVAINGWNRLCIAFQSQPPRRES